MSTRSTTTQGTITVSGRKIAAALTQIGSFVTTWLFVSALGVTGAPGFFLALAVEFVLMAAKHNTLLGRADQVGAAAVFIDTILNAGGLYPYMQRLDKTPSWIMLVSALNLEGELRKIPALVLALLFGFLLSAAPTWLWRHR